MKFKKIIYILYFTFLSVKCFSQPVPLNSSKFNKCMEQKILNIKTKIYKICNVKDYENITEKELNCIQKQASPFQSLLNNYIKECKNN